MSRELAFEIPIKAEGNYEGDYEAVKYHKEFTEKEKKQVEALIKVLQYRSDLKGEEELETKNREIIHNIRAYSRKKQKNRGLYRIS